jgi:hypothetical protein
MVYDETVDTSMLTGSVISMLTGSVTSMLTGSVTSTNDDVMSRSQE